MEFLISVLRHHCKCNSIHQGFARCFQASWRGAEGIIYQKEEKLNKDKERGITEKKEDGQEKKRRGHKEKERG